MELRFIETYLVRYDLETVDSAAHFLFIEQPQMRAEARFTRNAVTLGTITYAFQLPNTDITVAVFQFRKTGPYTQCSLWVYNAPYFSDETTGNVLEPLRNMIATIFTTIQSDIKQAIDGFKDDQILFFKKTIHEEPPTPSLSDVTRHIPRTPGRKRDQATLNARRQFYEEGKSKEAILASFMAETKERDPVIARRRLNDALRTRRQKK